MILYFDTKIKMLILSRRGAGVAK